MKFGKRQVRIEDDHLIRGEGQYVDDIHLPDMLHVSIVRSPVAHGIVRNVDRAAAQEAEGVVAVLTADDLPESAKIMPDGHPNPALPDPMCCQVLASDRVRYVGEPVAAVVAIDPYRAEDGAELVEIEIDTLDPVVDLHAAIAADSPLVHEDMSSNVAAKLAISKGDIAAAFSSASHVVQQTLEIHRGAGQAMETRGVVAQWHRLEKRLTVWNVSQVPHVHREIIATALELPERSVKVLTEDVGGGFGYKGLVYVEDILVPWLAKHLGVPIKWIEDRREHLTSSYHERSQLHELEMSLDAEGKILGIRGRFMHDHGAYTPWGPVVPMLTVVNIPGPYKISAYEVEALVVHTNCVPVAPVRGAGRPQAAYVMERMLDEAARVSGIDGVELRRRNLIQADEYPFDVGFVSRDGTLRTYDSGNVPALLEKALELVDYKRYRDMQAAAHSEGRFLGLGVACCVEEVGLGPHEEALVSIERDGTAMIRAGTPSQGQGQRTIFAQILSEELGVPFESIRVDLSDSDNVAHSIGTFASRAGIVTGSAIRNAAIELRERAIRIGATLLQAKEDELELIDGDVRAKVSPGRSIPLSEIVAVTLGTSGAPLPLPSRELGPGMTTLASFCPSAAAFSTGCHAAVVEVDTKTGKVRILEYAAVQDFGNVINSLIVDGQVFGGVAHGVGNTFLERVEYDKRGQCLTGTFMDYLMPTAMDVPRPKVAYVPTPSPLNPLGMKGAGQGGVIPVPAVLTSAVEDALAPLGVRLRRVPFKESDLLDMIRETSTVEEVT